MLFCAHGMFQPALSLLQRALRLCQSVFGFHHANTLRIMCCLGMVHWEMGSLENAEECFQNAIKICEKSFGSDHSNLVPVLSDLADVMLEMVSPSLENFIVSKFAWVIFLFFFLPT
jgi:hypothetical protein